MTRKKKKSKAQQKRLEDMRQKLIQAVYASCDLDGVYDPEAKKEIMLDLVTHIHKDHPELSEYYVLRLGESSALTKIQIDVSERLREIHRGTENETYRCIC